jgi:hypothetical protein
MRATWHLDKKHVINQRTMDNSVQLGRPVLKAQLRVRSALKASMSPEPQLPGTYRCSCTFTDRPLDAFSLSQDPLGCLDSPRPANSF